MLLSTFKRSERLVFLTQFSRRLSYKLRGRNSEGKYISYFYSGNLSYLINFVTPIHSFRFGSQHGRRVTRSMSGHDTTVVVSLHYEIIPQSYEIVDADFGLTSSLEYILCDRSFVHERGVKDFR